MLYSFYYECLHFLFLLGSHFILSVMIYVEFMSCSAAFVTSAGLIWSPLEPLHLLMAMIWRLPFQVSFLTLEGVLQFHPHQSAPRWLLTSAVHWTEPPARCCSKVVAQSFYYVEIISLLQPHKASFFRGWHNFVQFLQTTFLLLSSRSCNFHRWFDLLLYYIYWFALIGTVIHPGMKPTCSWGSIFSNVLLNLVCKVFVDNFCTYVHRENQSIFSDHIKSSFGLGNTGFGEWVPEHFFLFILWTGFRIIGILI